MEMEREKIELEKVAAVKNVAASKDKEWWYMEREKIELEKVAAVKNVAASKEWWYFGRNFSIPKYDTITCTGKGCADMSDSANAASVFEELKLDLRELSQIFVENSREYYSLKKEARPVQPVAENYNDLQECRAWDEEGWQNLSILTKKIIHFVHRQGESMVKETQIFYPIG